jgi:glutathione S-transferase
MLTLYLSPGSSSMAAHIALVEAGAAFEIRSLSFAKKEHREPWFRAINPAAKVPVLMIDGRVLTEVAGILWYVARRYPEAHLLPQGNAETEAQVVSWMSLLASGVHPARQMGIDHAMAMWRLAEQRLGGRAWAVGDTYSIADIHLFRLFWRFKGSLKPPDGTFPGLEAHHARMLARPAVQKVIATETAIGYELPG